MAIFIKYLPWGCTTLILGLVTFSVVNFTKLNCLRVDKSYACWFLCCVVDIVCK